MSEAEEIKINLRRGIRHAFLEGAYHSHLELLNLLASLGNAQMSIRESMDSSRILNITRSYIARLIHFRVTGFIITDEHDLSFTPTDCMPASNQLFLQKIVNHQIEAGTFAWALKQSRAVTIHNKPDNNLVVFHVMATRSRVLGMFVGVLEQEDSSGADVPLNLLSIILTNTAYTLENLSLYKKLNDYNQNLEKLVEQKTSQLAKANEELIKTKKLESVGVLAGGIAHDFNNMLTVILGNISLAKKSINSKQRSFNRLTNAEKACWRASSLTQQLLTFSKGGMPVTQIISISEIIKEAVSLALSGSHLRCEPGIPNNLAFVEVDESQIHQVLINLILNARQAMSNTGTLKIWAETITLAPKNTISLKEGPYVRICVQDEGVGIPEEHLQTIFDPFFTTKPSQSGLGLAVSYSIIKKHNGHITVESKPGTGTTFSIYLPAKQASADQLPIRKKTTGKSPAIGKQRILIMDDEEPVRILAVDMLADLGHEPEAAKDGEEAVKKFKIAKAKGKSFHLVIMDLTVAGGMGGKEAMRKLLKIDSNVKAIVSSGYSNDPILSDFKKFGFKGMLTKPHQISDLNEAVNRVLSTT